MTGSATASTRHGAWRNGAAFALGSAFFCYAFAVRVSPSVMVEELMRDFAVGAAILGNLSAFYFYAYGALQIPVGVLMDRFGPRRLMTAAAGFCAVGSLVFALSDAILGAYVGRLMIGAGAAFSWVGVLTIVTRALPARRFTLFAGLAQLIGMAGGVLGQAPLAAVIAVAGWRPALLGFAGFGFALCVLLWFVIRDGRSADHVPIGLGAHLRAVVASPAAWLNAAFGLSTAGPMLAFGALWAVPYMTTVYGLDRPTAAAVVSSLFVGWGIGCPLWGWLSDRLGRPKPLMIVAGVLSTATLAGSVYLPGLTVPAIVALIGAHGAAASGMILAFASVRPHVPAAATSTAYGFVNTAVIGSGALFQPLIGLLLDLQWTGEMEAGARVYSAAAYRWSFLVLVVGGIVGTVAAAAIREPRRFR